MLLHVVFSVQKNKNLFESIILKIKSTPFQTFVHKHLCDFNVIQNIQSY